MKTFKIMKNHLRGNARELADQGLPDYLPFSTVEPFERRANLNHAQTLERLNERGGLDSAELVALFENRPLFGPRARIMTEAEAITRLSLWLSLAEDLEGNPARTAAAVERLNRELERVPASLGDPAEAILKLNNEGLEIKPDPERSDCCKCIHRGEIPDDDHSQCKHPEAREGLSSDPIAAMGEAFRGKADKGRISLGVKSAGPTWPANFDPVFVKTCLGFTKGGRS